MSAQLGTKQEELLRGKNVAYLATLAKDGSPQVTPVWIDYDGTHVLVSTEEKRAKAKHVKRDPRVALTVAAADNPYSYVELRGKVAEITTEGAMELIDTLTQKYMGQDKYPWHQPGDVRLILKIEIEKALGNAG